jgi:hypothetical protein
MKYFYKGRFTQISAIFLFFSKENRLSINKRNLSVPTLCHFLSDFMSRSLKTTLCRSDDVSFFIWLYVGHSKMISCRPDDVVSFFLNLTQCKIFGPIFFRCKKTLYTHHFFFQNTAQCFFLKHRFLFYTVYCAGVIFGNFWCKPECKCKC